MITYEVKVCSNGDVCWRINSKRHRENGPAVEKSNGDKFWFIGDRLHREDGPAIEYADGEKEWYIDGKELSESAFYNRSIEEMTLAQVCKEIGRDVKIIK